MTPRVQTPSLTDGLFQLSFLLQDALGRIASEHDLSIIQVRLLGILRDREPGMLALARHLKLEKSSLSGLVDRAEQRGLVERIPSPGDGRGAHVRVTARGRKLSRIVENAVNAEVAALLTTVSKSDREQLTRLLRRIVASGGDRG